MKKVLLVLMILIAVLAIASCTPTPNQHTHTITGELIVVKEATCAEEGKAYMFCTGCGEIVNTVVIEKTNNHTEKILPAIESTCKVTGLTEGKKCSVCEKILVAQQESPLKAHTEEVIPAVDATCTETGLSEGVKCSVCDTILVKQIEIPMIAHTYEDKYDESCNKCGFIRDAECAHRETETIKGYEATCTSAGLTDGTKCKKCGEILTEQTVISLKDHTVVIDHAVEATCASTGLTEGKHCSECGTILVAQEVTPLGEHLEIIEGGYEAPTCTESGLTNWVHCSGCNTYLQEQEVIPAMGHGFGEWITVKEATTTEEGLQERICACGEKETQNIDKLIQASEGLEFTLNDDGASYSVTGIGTCTDIAIVIPSSYNGLPVTSIGDVAFIGVDLDNTESYQVTLPYYVISIDIPDTITTIGMGAFAYCYNLTEINIPDNVTTIGDVAFAYCMSLEGIIIPDSVTSIGDSVFEECRNLKDVVLPNSITSIGTHAFAGCYMLENLIIPDSVISIGNYAFEGCGKLYSVVIGKNVESIGEYAFAACYKIAEVINKSQLNITTQSEDHGMVAYRAFEVHNGSSKITNIDDYLFYTTNDNKYLLGYIGNESVLTLPTLSNNQKYVIHNYAFNCFYNGPLTGTYVDNGIISIIIPNCVTSIGHDAFHGCDNLTSIVIPDFVRSIGDYAFQYCSSLTSIEIGYSVTSIGKSAFWGCDSLLEVINKSSLNIVAGSSDYGYVGYCAKHILTYESQSAIKNVGDYIFYDDETDIYLVKYLGSDTEITLPEYDGGKDYSIYKDAFRNCTSLKSVVIGDSVTSIGSGAFAWCESITSIVIPDSVTSIGERLFYNCTSLTSINFDGTVEQWNAISKGNNWNYDVPATEVVCSDGTVKLK